jgi:hypothetical protein
VKRFFLIVALGMTAGGAQAAGIGLRAGTTGLGADFGWGFGPTLGGRIGLSGMSFSADVDTSEVRYDARPKLLNLSALLDWSPLGPFRISGGLVAHDNKIDVTGQPTSAAFQGSTVTGTVKPEHSVAPYLGVGYGNVWTKGVNFYFDLGILFQGSPKADLRVSCGPSVTPAQCAAAQSQLEAEERRIEDELKRFKVYPVLNLGVTIGF